MRHLKLNSRSTHRSLLFVLSAIMSRAFRVIRQASDVTKCSAIWYLAARSFANSAKQNNPVNLPNALNGTTNLHHEGSYSRTDSTVQVEHSSKKDLPKREPVEGRGGLHYKKTYSSFSLEGKVGVVTGGARGLGLMMSQALINNGADLAIVDLDGMGTSLMIRYMNVDLK